MTKEKEMTEALERIYEEAEKLLVLDSLPEEALKSIERILSISRYEFDSVGPDN